MRQSFGSCSLFGLVTSGKRCTSWKYSTAAVLFPAKGFKREPSSSRRSVLCFYFNLNLLMLWVEKFSFQKPSTANQTCPLDSYCFHYVQTFNTYGQILFLWELQWLPMTTMILSYLTNGIKSRVTTHISSQVYFI